MIAAGSFVVIRPEWRDRPDDPREVYVCVDCQGNGRVTISPVEWEWPLVPLEVVSVSMVEEITVEEIAMMRGEL